MDIYKFNILQSLVPLENSSLYAKQQSERGTDGLTYLCWYELQPSARSLAPANLILVSWSPMQGTFSPYKVDLQGFVLEENGMLVDQARLVQISVVEEVQ